MGTLTLIAGDIIKPTKLYKYSATLGINQTTRLQHVPRPECGIQNQLVFLLYATVYRQPFSTGDTIRTTALHRFLTTNQYHHCATKGITYRLIWFAPASLPIHGVGTNLHVYESPVLILMNLTMVTTMEALAPTIMEAF